MSCIISYFGCDKNLLLNSRILLRYGVSKAIAGKLRASNCKHRRLFVKGGAFLTIRLLAGWVLYLRKYFFGIEPWTIRQVLVNYDGSRNAVKRPGTKDLRPFEDEIYLTDEKADELVNLEEALTILEKMEP